MVGLTSPQVAAPGILPFLGALPILKILTQYQLRDLLLAFDGVPVEDILVALGAIAPPLAG